jgi:hypothetical protein
MKTTMTRSISTLVTAITLPTMTMTTTTTMRTRSKATVSHNSNIMAIIEALMLRKMGKSIFCFFRLCHVTPTTRLCAEGIHWSSRQSPESILPEVSSLDNDILLAKEEGQGCKGMVRRRLGYAERGRCFEHCKTFQCLCQAIMATRLCLGHSCPCVGVQDQGEQILRTRTSFMKAIWREAGHRESNSRAMDRTPLCKTSPRQSNRRG